MPLSEEQLRKLNEWFQSKRLNPQCPSCGTNDWTTGDIVSAPVYTAGGIAIGGSIVPMVQVICKNCGYIRLHAAVPIGLL